MITFDYIKNIFSGEKNQYNQIAIFSLIGIMTLFFNNTISALVGSYYGVYFGFPPVDKFIINLNFICAVVLGIFFIGYKYKFVLEIFQKDETLLPDISLNSFLIFAKSLPVTIVWGLYFCVLFFLGFSIFKIWSVPFYTFCFLLFFLYQFVEIVNILFMKNIITGFDVFSPIFFGKVVKNTFFDVLSLFFENILLFVVAGFILFKIFEQTDYLASMRTLQLGTRIGTLCLSVYFFQLIKFSFFQGFADIIYDKFLKD